MVLRIYKYNRNNNGIVKFGTGVGQAFQRFHLSYAFIKFSYPGIVFKLYSPAKAGLPSKIKETLRLHNKI